MTTDINTSTMTVPESAIIFPSVPAAIRRPQRLKLANFIFRRRVRRAGFDNFFDNRVMCGARAKFNLAQEKYRANFKFCGSGGAYANRGRIDFVLNCAESHL